MRVLKAIRFGPQHHDGKGQVFELLLMRQAFIHREEDIKLARIRNEPQKLPVLDARPTRAENCLDFVTGQVPSQTRGQAFVEQDAHSGVRNQQLTRLFQQGNGLFSADRREILQKIIQRVAALQVINRRPGRNARPGKAGRTAHYFRVNFDNRACLHALN